MIAIILAYLFTDLWTEALDTITDLIGPNPQVPECKIISV